MSKNKESFKLKLLCFIPIYSWKIRNNKKIWKILEIPFIKRVIDSENNITKYYLFGLLVLKIKVKQREVLD
ncbi:MAG: hypothetical protein IJ564_06400 [Alphaproteobacteria bacterium]|nr:hypothetical protein [Alphaproteobacteria bacterium]